VKFPGSPKSLKGPRCLARSSTGPAPRLTGPLASAPWEGGPRALPPLQAHGLHRRTTCPSAWGAWEGEERLVGSSPDGGGPGGAAIVGTVRSVVRPARHAPPRTCWVWPPTSPPRRWPSPLPAGHRNHLRAPPRALDRVWVRHPASIPVPESGTAPPASRPARAFGLFRLAGRPAPPRCGAPPVAAAPAPPLRPRRTTDGRSSGMKITALAGGNGRRQSLLRGIGPRPRSARSHRSSVNTGDDTEIWGPATSRRT